MPDSEPREHEHHNEANERTSLISERSNRSNRDHRSDRERGEEFHEIGPSDINPLNQRSARIYRAVLIVLFSLALFWLALLSIDQLISIGVGATQGSGFETYVVTLLGVASIGASLLFYKAPSPSDRTMNLLCAAILIIDMLIISMVEQLRRRIGPIPMLISFGGSVIAFLVSSQTDTIVQKAKAEEQERLMGHTSVRRSWIEWVGVVLSNTFRVLVFVLVVLFTVNLIFDAADSHVAVGELVKIGGVPDGNNDGTVIHLACSPAGPDGPVAIIEAGETSGEDMHGWVQRVRGLKAVCFYDRPGFGLSDNAASPLAMEATVSYLAAALQQQRPEIKDEKLLLISHGVGSLYSRVFASKMADQIAGIVLIDGLHEELFYSDQTTLHGLREFFRGLYSTVSITKLSGVLRGLGVEERLFGLLTYSQPRLHKSLLQQQVSANRRSSVDIDLATSSLPADTPALIVSSAQMCKDRQWNRHQRLLLKLTENVVAWKILEGPHNLWWDRRAEKDLIEQVQSFVGYLKNH